MDLTAPTLRHMRENHVEQRVAVLTGIFAGELSAAPSIRLAIADE